MSPENCENGKPYYSTFVFYNDKQQRMSIFAEEAVFEDGENALMITAIPCNPKDEFSKKEGRRRYEEKDWTVGERFYTPVVEDMPKKSFMRWCKLNYFQFQVMTLEMDFEVYVKRDPDAPKFNPEAN